jgi:hypothetical protein
MVGETYQRGRLHVGRRRDARRSAEGHLVRVGKRIGRHLRQALGHAHLALDDDAAQAVEIARYTRKGRFGAVHGSILPRAAILR